MLYRAPYGLHGVRSAFCSRPDLGSYSIRCLVASDSDMLGPKLSGPRSCHKHSSHRRGKGIRVASEHQTLLGA